MFTKKYSSLLAAAILAILGIGYYFFAHKTEQAPPPEPTPAVVATTTPAAEVQPPTVSFEIQKGKTSSTVIVHWGNLPKGTTKLNVYISKKNQNKWSLWQTVSISQNDLNGGFAAFKTNSAIAGGGYSFYAEADNGTGSGPIWSSSSTEPVYSTSTSPQGNSPQPPPPPPPPPPSIPPPPAGAPENSSTQNSSGTTYYTPSGGISGSQGPQTANFWVQHMNNKSLEIDWQNIPSDTDDVIIYRSQNSSGTWMQILEQPNPASSYSIGLVDNTLHDTYYYKMDALHGGTQIAEYGPVELPPL